MQRSWRKNTLSFSPVMQNVTLTEDSTIIAIMESKKPKKLNRKPP